jgi:hypothetical protein
LLFAVPVIDYQTDRARSITPRMSKGSAAFAVPVEIRSRDALLVSYDGV